MGAVEVGPRVWPGHTGVQPGDLSQLAPMGNGIGAPLVVLPWGGAPGAGAYALHPHPVDPRLAGPTTEPVGGVVFFEAHTPPADLDGLWRALAVGDDQDYAAFVEEPAGPGRYGAQLRLVSRFALRFLFRVPDAEGAPQPIGMREALHAFVAARTAERSDLTGWLGGDGDWASEVLGFGFCVENAYHRVYRIWVRPWLVTK